MSQKNRSKPIDDNEFAILADHLPDFIARYDSQGRILFLNKKLHLALGLPPGPMDLVRTTELFPDGRFDEYEKKILQCAASGNEDSLDMTVPDFNGRMEHHHIRIVAERDYEGQVVGVIAFGRDMTERFLLEQQLTNASRLASLGEMAGGIAHEINNPLAVIKGKCFQILQLQKRGEFSYDGVEKLVRDIETISTRIASVVRGLKSFSREASDDPFVTQSIRAIIEDSLSFCEQKMKNENVTLHRLFAEKADIQVACRSAQIAQVIVNLLSNSMDALKTNKDAAIWIDIHDSGDSLRISVEDNGPGIPKEFAAKIMQPFFTTKPVGTGTGLGLSISKGIAQAHHGDLELESSERPTRFVLRLPKSQGAFPASALV